MKTDALIERLAENAAPVRAGAVTRALALGLGAGAAVSFALMVLSLGVRPDLMEAMDTNAYWMKFFYTLLLAAAGLWTVERLSRPGAPARTQMMLELLPLVAIVVLGMLELGQAPRAMHNRMIMGASSNVCPWLIVVLALPIFAGVFWSLRRLAPTRPLVAGAAAGVLAGAAGAFIYAFHCNESAASFVAVWYTFGIAMVGVLGALAGRVLLRW